MTKLALIYHASLRTCKVTRLFKILKSYVKMSGETTKQYWCPSIFTNLFEICPKDWRKMSFWRGRLWDAMTLQKYQNTRDHGKLTLISGIRLTSAALLVPLISSAVGASVLASTSDILLRFVIILLEWRKVDGQWCLSYTESFGLERQRIALRWLADEEMLLSCHWSRNFER